MTQEQLHKIMIEEYSPRHPNIDIITKFFNSEYRKRVYAMILDTLLYRFKHFQDLDNYARRPYICEIVKLNLFPLAKSIELRGSHPDLYTSADDIIHYTNEKYNCAKIPLTLLLPELIRPDKDEYFDSWFSYYDFKSRIELVIDAQLTLNK